MSDLDRKVILSPRDEILVWLEVKLEVWKKPYSSLGLNTQMAELGKTRCETIEDLIMVRKREIQEHHEKQVVKEAEYE
jgi:hypothetical protein